MTSLFSQEVEYTNTTICWDISASAAERDLDKGFSVSEKLFLRYPNQEVQLLVFGMAIEEDDFSIKKVNWS